MIDFNFKSLNEKNNLIYKQPILESGCELQFHNNLPPQEVEVQSCAYGFDHKFQEIAIKTSF